jgi:hypothetical protein
MLQQGKCMRESVRRPAGGMVAACVAVYVTAFGLVACGGGGSSSEPAAAAVEVELSGPTSQTLSVAAGGQATAMVQPGTAVSIVTSGQWSWRPSADDAGYTVQEVTPTTKRATVDSVVGGTVTFDLVSDTDPTQKATITLTVDARAFEAGKRQISEVAKWQRVVVPQKGPSVVDRLRSVVVQANADGSHEDEWVSDSGSEGRTVYDAADNVVLTRDSAGADICRFEPAQLEYQFPLKFGNTWTGTWSADCLGATVRNGESRFEVDAYEKVKVGAGTFDALRVSGSIVHTNVTDPALPSGAEGKATYTQTQRCWWAPSLQRTVRCELSYDWAGAKPDGYARSAVWALSDLKRP